MYNRKSIQNLRRHFSLYWRCISVDSVYLNTVLFFCIFKRFFFVIFVLLNFFYVIFQVLFMSVRLCDGLGKWCNKDVQFIRKAFIITIHGYSWKLWEVIRTWESNKYYFRFVKWQNHWDFQLLEIKGGQLLKIDTWRRVTPLRLRCSHVW